MDQQWKSTISKSRLPGESRKIVVIDRPSQFDEKFDEFVASMGIFKIIAVNFKSDELPEGFRKLSKSARAARRRRERRTQLRKNLAGDAYNDNNYQPMTTQFDAGDNGNGADAQAENEDEGLSEDEERELTEDELCEHIRRRNHELGKVALISMSTLSGNTLIIRTCYFSQFPEKLWKMLEGKDFLKIGFGIQADKRRVYDKYGFFVMNFVDPRRPLFAWKNFVDTYHFERFGAYSVASYLFQSEIQNVDAAACLSSQWSAPDLNPFLERGAARETQLTADVYGEMCVQMLERRSNRFSLCPLAYNDPTFYSELMQVTEGHINNGFDMKNFGVKVFSTPALQRRFQNKMMGGRKATGVATRDVVPPTFADRVRLRQSKSTVEKFWTTRMLYAGFDIALFGKNAGAMTQPLTLRRKVEDTIWEMKVEVLSKITEQMAKGPASYLTPAVGYYQQKEEERKPNEARACANDAVALTDEWDEADENAFDQNDLGWNVPQATDQTYEGDAELASIMMGVPTNVEIDGFLNNEYSGPRFSPAPHSHLEPEIRRCIGRGRGRLSGVENAVSPPPPMMLPPRGRGSFASRDQMLLQSISDPVLKNVGAGRGRGIGMISAANGSSAVMLLPKSRGPRLGPPPP